MESTNNIESLEKILDRVNIIKTLAAGAVNKIEELETFLPTHDLDRINATTDILSALGHETEAIKNELNDVVLTEYKKRSNTESERATVKLSAEQFLERYTQQNENNKRIIADLLRALDTAAE